MSHQEKWLSWAKELQAIAQTGLYYCKDNFDIERYNRVREIAVEMLSEKSGISTEIVKNLFANEIGYQTPKIDTRAAIFENDKILLVKEKNGTWSLPGGWCDVDVSVKENIIKEVKEEAGLDINVDLLIAVQDRSKHNLPIYPYSVNIHFFLCSVLGGKFEKNIETIESKYFKIDDLPKLAEEKNNKEQIEMCYNAYKSDRWKTLFE